MGRKKNSEPGSQKSHDCLVRACIKLLLTCGWAAWRIESKPVIVCGGIPIKRAIAGIPDIVAIEPTTGKFCGFEVKTGNSRLKKSQMETRDKIIACNGEFFVVRSIDDLVNTLRQKGFVD